MVQAKPSFWLLLAFSIVLVPIKWVLAWLIAVMVHEVFHVLVLHTCGCKICEILIGASGIEIITESLSARQEILSAAAGPIGSFLLLLVARYSPVIAVCGFVQGAYNLLPLHPLDGGRVCRIVLRKFFSDRLADYVMDIIKILIYILMLVGAAILFKISGNFVALIVAVCLVWKDGKNTLQKSV